ncbi:MAG: insulinase family protein [Bacteroidetes bacterium]|nr:insulinase family protein [Bacteroidota bacterium]
MIKKNVLLVALAAACSLTQAQNKAVSKNNSAPFQATKPGNNISPKLIESVEKKSENDLLIPYKKYVLSNGMNVLIHEDHSDPVVYVDVTYHVGSAREQEGRSGFAHFFEHMMFQGSKHVADEAHFKIVTEAGGTLNGSTNTDRTNYFEVLPSNQLETALWLESDRMGFLLDSVTQAKFETQRATVKNERGQNYDNRPYGLVSEKIGEALYPEGHPYSWTTIGYIEDLNRVDVNDLKRFYLRWYGPNNATLTLAGDVNPEKVLPLIEKYFGSIPAGIPVARMPKTTAKLSANRYISYEDNVKFPMLVLTWPSAPVYSAESAALDALGHFLAGSKSTPLEMNLIKTKKAVSVAAYNYDRELAGQFQIQIRANQDSKLSEVQEELSTILNNWEKQGGVTDEQLARYKTDTKSTYISRLTTVQGKGAALAQYQTIAGNANFMQKELEAVNKLTKQEIMNVYYKYIKNKPCVTLSVVPKGKTDAKAHEDNWSMYKRTIQNESAEYKGLQYLPLRETFDRSKQPISTENPVVKTPEFWKDSFKNGLQFIGTYSNEVPKVSIQISILAGHRFEDINRAGLAYLMADMLNESTQDHSAEEISDMLEALGASVDVSCGNHEITLNISSLTENIDKTIAIAEEILFKPKFSEEDFERCKKQQIDVIHQQQTSAREIASQQFMQILYGTNNTMALPTYGTIGTVNNITLDDIKRYYLSHLSPSQTKIVVVGNLNKEQMMPKLQFFSQWKEVPVKKLEENPVPKIAKTKIYFIDKKNAPQSEIRVGCMAMPFDALGTYYKSSIMNFPFAGSFNSRLNLLLREKRGFTYGAGGSFRAYLYDGYYMASTGVRANATDSALVDLMSELKKYIDTGISADELGFTKSSMGQNDALKYESPFGKAGFLKEILTYDLNGDYPAKQNQILQNISVAEINDLAKKNLPYNNMNIIVVGDKQSNLEKIKKLGYEVILLDISGKEVSE